MKIPALRVHQSGHVLYLAKMTAEQILTCCHTAEWDPNLGWDLSQQGYQRSPVESHYQSIGHFLKDNPHVLLPTSALLSAREQESGQLAFEVTATSQDSEFGELDLEAWRQFVIIDYQHRWRGLRFAIDVLGAHHLKDFVVPATIIADLTRADEIEQFFLINSKQRRIDTDLALALLQTLASQAQLPQLYNLVGPGKRYRVRATRITFQLAAVATGPWKGRIAQPHDLPQPDAVIKIKSFVDSLAPVMSSRESISARTNSEILNILTMCWTALSHLFPTAFADPSAYQIQRTVGTFAFNLLLARDIYPRLQAAGTVNIAGFESVLKKIGNPYLQESFWLTGGPASLYVGSSGWRSLRNLMRAGL